MEKEDKAKWTLVEWGVIASLIMSGGGLVFSIGVLWADVQQHARDIDGLKQHDTDQIDRLARIETKIDLLIAGRDDAEGLRRK